MPHKFSKLELAWRTRNGGAGRTRREYLDFIVDGQSLHDLLSPGDNIGCLGWLPPDAERRYREELTATRLSALGNNRCPIYVCAECGDLGCGAITVQIDKTKDGFVWRRFGYENDYAESMSDFAGYESIGPFYFNESEYLETLKSGQDAGKRDLKNKQAG